MYLVITGRKRRGTVPATYMKASGAIHRNILQQLEKMQLIQADQENGYICMLPVCHDNFKLFLSFYLVVGGSHQRGRKILIKLLDRYIAACMAISVSGLWGRSKLYPKLPGGMKIGSEAVCHRVKRSNV